jgi:hypothetical protein
MVDLGRNKKNEGHPGSFAINDFLSINLIPNSLPLPIPTLKYAVNFYFYLIWLKETWFHFFTFGSFHSRSNFSKNVKLVAGGAHLGILAPCKISSV